MKTIYVTATAVDGRKVKMTAAQAQAIETMTNTRKGGCASVKGYRPASSWIVSPIQDIQLITHFSTKRLYERRIKALEAVEIGDIAADMAKEPKLAKLSIQEATAMFDERKAGMIATLQKTLDGDRDDAHRQAHDRCYAYVGDVKLHLLTEKVDGVKVPVEDDDGAVIVASIMVPYLELNVKTIVEGERKPAPNSRADVRIGKLIEKCLNKRSVIYKTLSLKDDNFEEFNVDRNTFLPEDVATFGDILTEAA